MPREQHVSVWFRITGSGVSWCESLGLRVKDFEFLNYKDYRLWCLGFRAWGVQGTENFGQLLALGFGVGLRAVYHDSGLACPNHPLA